MKWTGHSDYSSMKPYIDIVDSIKASSMTKRLRWSQIATTFLNSRLRAGF